MNEYNTIEIELSDGTKFRWVVHDDLIDGILDAVETQLGHPDTLIL